VADETYSTLRSAVKATAGEGAIDCGAVNFDAPRAPAFACAESALDDGKPFSLVLRTDAVDARKLSGTARDKSGRIFLIESTVQIDNDLSKKEKVRTNISKCAWLKFQDKATKPIVCLRPQN
jgi:hypothetical protein